MIAMFIWTLSDLFTVVFLGGLAAIFGYLCIYYYVSELWNKIRTRRKESDK